MGDDDPLVLPRDLVGPDVPSEVDDLLWARLTQGRLDEVRAAVEPLSEPRPLLLEMLRVDGVVRRQAAHLHEIAQLRARVRRERPDWVNWITVLSAEHLLWVGDVTSLSLAIAATDTGPAATTTVDEVGDRWAAQADARLLRLSGIAEAVTFDEDHGHALAVFATAVERMRTIGQAEEEAVTWMIFWFVVVLLYHDRADDILPVLRDYADTLWEIGSDRRGFAELAVGWVAVFGRDLASARASIERLHGADLDLSSFNGLVFECLQASTELLGDDVSDASIERMTVAGRALVERGGMVGGSGIYMAGLLLDRGLVREAEQILPLRNSAAHFAGPGWYDLEFAYGRLGLLRAPGPDSLAEIERIVADSRTENHPRRVAGSLLRVARDCDRLGFGSAAAAFRAEADRDLPPLADRSRRERELSEPVDAIVRPRAGEVRVLQPDLVVRRFGNEVALGAVLSKLVVLLAAVGRPVTTDWIIEALWPEIDPDRGRHRLKAAIYRLRKHLALGPGELVLRTEHGVELKATDGWFVDTAAFLRLAKGTAEERREAAALYGADLAERQFAYDDLVAEERVRWRERRSALADPG